MLNVYLFFSLTIYIYIITLTCVSKYTRKCLCTKITVQSFCAMIGRFTSDVTKSEPDFEKEAILLITNNISHFQNAFAHNDLSKLLIPLFNHKSKGKKLSFCVP